MVAECVLTARGAESIAAAAARATNRHLCRRPGQAAAMDASATSLPRRLSSYDCRKNWDNFGVGVDGKERGNGTKERTESLLRAAICPNCTARCFNTLGRVARSPKKDTYTVSNNVLLRFTLCLILFHPKRYIRKYRDPIATRTFVNPDTRDDQTFSPPAVSFVCILHGLRKVCICLTG
jgi:hypothetical protein